MGDLLRVRTLVLQHIAKQDEEKTTDFLCDFDVVDVQSRVAGAHSQRLLDAKRFRVACEIPRFHLRQIQHTRHCRCISAFAFLQPPTVPVGKIPLN